MKNISFTNAGIAFLILLQLGTLGYLTFGRHKGNHERGHHSKGPAACPASFKEGCRGEGNFNGQQRGHRPNDFMAFEGLNLTPEQQTKIDALKLDYTKSEDANRIKVRELRKKQFQLLKEEKLDDAQAESIATQIGQYKKEEVLTRMKFLRSVQQILTKEQKAMLNERRNKQHGPRPEDDQETK